MQILNNINTIPGKRRIQDVKCGSYVRLLMTSIINYHIKSAEFLNDRTQKALVRLIANSNLNLIFLKRQFLFNNIDANDPCMRTEERFPHLQ